MNINQVSVITNTALQQGAARNNSVFKESFSHTDKSFQSVAELEKKMAGNPSLEELSNAVEDANKVVQSVRKNLIFNLHEETERFYVEVKDIDTDEVIKELPPKEFLDMVAKIREYVGLMIDEKI